MTILLLLTLCFWRSASGEIAYGVLRASLASTPKIDEFSSGNRVRGNPGTIFTVSCPDDQR